MDCQWRLSDSAGPPQASGATIFSGIRPWYTELPALIISPTSSRSARLQSGSDPTRVKSVAQGISVSSDLSHPNGQYSRTVRHRPRSQAQPPDISAGRADQPRATVQPCKSPARGRHRLRVQKPAPRWSRQARARRQAARWPSIKRQDFQTEAGQNRTIRHKGPPPNKRTVGTFPDWCRMHPQLLQLIAKPLTQSQHITCDINTAQRAQTDIARRQDSAPLYLINLNTRRCDSNRRLRERRCAAPPACKLRTGRDGLYGCKSVRQSPKRSPPSRLPVTTVPSARPTKRHGQTAARPRRRPQHSCGLANMSCGFPRAESYSDPSCAEPQVNRRVCQTVGRQAAADSPS